jgi:flavin prenyltransferase
LNNSEAQKTMSASITLAITGASGSIYGLKSLEFLLASNFSVELILSATALKVIKIELGLDLSSKNAEQKSSLEVYFKQVNADVSLSNLNIWSVDNLAASISSGSYRNQGMIIIPCSMGAIGRIANGTSEDLIARSADVCLKERKKLVIVPRETPLNSIHLENMLKLSREGAHIVPAMPAFYNQPKSIDDLVSFVVGKAMDCFGVENQIFKRWQ